MGVFKLDIKFLGPISLRTYVKTTFLLVMNKFDPHCRDIKQKNLVIYL